MKFTQTSLLILGALFCFQTVQAQEIDSDPKSAINDTRMIESANSKIYRARVLLEDYRNWPEAYELLRTVIKNDDTLNKVAKKKLEKAARQVKYYLPSRWIRKKINGRHLIRPFLEASYLINEALMDSRVALNTSSDSEVLFVEKLLKSYFFPGNEANAVIEFPKHSTYAFDLYALTAENISKARRERSDQKDAEKSAPISDEYDDRNNGGPRLDNGRPRLDNPRANVNSTNIGGDFELDDQTLNNRFANANGFILDLIENGTAIAEITKEVKDLIKRYSVPNRVHNRYLELSMLLQAVVDPGTVLFDPQLQSFLQGVRLKVALGVTEEGAKEELLSMKSVLGSKAVVQSGDETRIRLRYLMDQQYKNGQLKSGLELSLKDVKGSGRSILYAISTISGEDQLALKTLQIAATLARDADKMAAVSAAAVKTYPMLGKIGSLTQISLSKLVTVLPKAVQAVNRIAAATNSGVTGGALRSLAGILKGVVSVQNVGVSMATKLGPKASNLLAAVKSNKYVKNGTATGILSLVVATTQITVGVIEYRATDDEDEKFEIYIDTTSRVAATATYMLPYIGWAAAALDLSHAFLGVPFETADIYKGYAWLVGETTLWFMGLSSAKIKMIEMESAMNLPRHNVFFARHAKVHDYMVVNVDTTNESLTKLNNELIDLTLGEMTFLYVSHRTFASDSNYSFRERIEEHFRSFNSNLKVIKTTREELETRLEGLMADAEVDEEVEVQN